MNLRGQWAVLVLFICLPHLALALPSFTGRPGDEMPERAGSHTSRVLTDALPDGEHALRGAPPARSNAGTVMEVDRPRAATPELQLGWQVLESQSSRSWSETEIDLELDLSASTEDLDRARVVESLWQAGEHGAAIQELRQLEEQSAPVRSLTQYRTAGTGAGDGGGEPWGVDIVIEGDLGPPLENFTKLCLETDPTTGNLVAISATELVWSMNLSTDGGVTWNERLRQTGFVGNEIEDVDCTVVGDAFFVVYARAGVPQRAFWYSMDSVTGLTYDDGVVATYPANVRDLAFASNSEEFDNRLYVVAILATSDLNLHWSDETATTWNQIATPVDDASSGVDIVWNTQFDDWLLFFTYRNMVGDIVVLRLDNDLNWDSTFMDAGIRGSIAAFDERIMVVFPLATSSDIRYWVSYDAGDAWFFGDVATQSPGHSYRSPSVTGIQGAGFRVIYLDERGAGPVDELLTQHRDYGTGPGQAQWGGPIRIDDDDPFTATRPSIQWVPALGPGDAYAALWVRDGDFKAMFDRSDGVTTAIEEVAAAPEVSGLSLSAWPTPYRGGRLNVRLRSMAGAGLSGEPAIALFDLRGRLVRRLEVTGFGATELVTTWDGRGAEGNAIPGGVYFLRAEGVGSAVPARKITVVR